MAATYEIVINEVGNGTILRDGIDISQDIQGFDLSAG